MRITKRAALQLVVLILTLTASLHAEIGGGIAGTVTDRATGEPLYGANIAIVGTMRGASTNELGQYSIIALPPGMYDIQITYLGYRAVVVSEVRVHISQTARVDIELDEEAIFLDEVTVTVERLTIRPDVATSEVSLSRSDIDAGFGGPVPFFGKQLGDMRFYVTYRGTREMLLFPLTRPDYRDYDVSFRVNSDITPDMKLRLSGLIGKQFTMRHNWDATGFDNTGNYFYPRFPTQVAGVISSIGSYHDWLPMFSDFSFSLADIGHQSIALKFSHFLSTSTFYEISVDQFQRYYYTRQPAIETGEPPRIDGVDDDHCWQNVSWQPIAQVWIPYGTEVDSHDFSGRYKVVWSSENNLLYFLVEVTDNVFVDGFIPGVTADIYNYDIIEVFIDEDASGGLHVFDGEGETALEWGGNAENAFAYHIYADYPDEGTVTTEFYAGDLAGTGWDDVIQIDYTSHIPEFALRRTGNTAVWEFSLIVYDDTYDHHNPEESRSRLYAGKEMGLSLAYCDNDDPYEEPKTRDKFFGSVWVPAEAYNHHWIDADYFGRVRLVADEE
jgi:hypothetical protein